MSKPKWTIKRVLQTSLLFLVLVALPLGSWFYLQGGLDYRMEALAELEDMGPIPMFEWVDQDGEAFDKDKCIGNLLIAGFLPFGEDREEYINRMNKLHDQFDNRTDVYFLTFVPTSLKQVLHEPDARQDVQQWKWVQIPDDQIEAVAATYAIPSNEKSALWITLVDDKGAIRKHYHYQDNKEMGRLVEHMAMLLPNSVPRKVQ
ncbi:MAG: hypothetical protein KDC34_13835 [Saprospiraceae bacterium]|nr:hypothetical protein [Saprospiraceae bacterium]